MLRVAEWGKFGYTRPMKKLLILIVILLLLGAIYVMVKNNVSGSIDGFTPDTQKDGVTMTLTLVGTASN